MHDPADMPEGTRQAAFAAVSSAFASLGRVCMALDTHFRVRHASPGLDALVGAGAHEAMLGMSADVLFGAELFGAGAPLREALLAGERREGWRASVGLEPGRTRLVGLSVAPLVHETQGVCDPEAAYLVVLRPEEDEAGAGPMGFGGLVARSPAMTRVFALIQNLEQSEATILLSGESGTGKEVVARAIHEHSQRRRGPLVAVNCAALPSELLDSELFGHVKGAFTGASRDREGRFELAAGGTLFLDEIADVPIHLQGKLLRVLQERTFERVGESHSRETDARIIAATHVDLRQAVSRGAFREDLYYRLHVVPIHLPPLRERAEDIEPLARHLLSRVCARSGRALRFSPDALRALLSYPWPGNVREMENALEYAAAVCRGQTLLPEDLPPEVAGQRADVEGHEPSRGERGEASDEREALRAALEAHHWRRDAVARALGISRTTLWRKMRELRLSR